MRDNPPMNREGFLDSVARQVQLADDVAHRPWPLPDRPWAQAQTRRDVLFAHWPAPLDELARLLPPELALDTFDGTAWFGAVACRLAHLRLRGLVPVPGLSSGLQLEFLTYVTHDGRPGLWHFALEAGNPLLVEAAKRAHRLPAYHARIEATESGGSIGFEATRDGLVFRAIYAGGGPEGVPSPGSFEGFFADRYALYTADGGRLYRAELHHAPPRLQAAQGEVGTMTLSPVAVEGEPRLSFAASQDLLIWSLEEL